MCTKSPPLVSAIAQLPLARLATGSYLREHELARARVLPRTNLFRYRDEIPCGRD